MMNLELIGKKIGMTRIYDESGNAIPVTVIQLGPCPIVQVKTEEKDKYAAVQIAHEEQKERRMSKPMLEHYAKANVKPHKRLKEFRTEGSDRQFEVGEVLSIKEFKEGQKIDVIGTTKGKGFQGVVKRWGFHGGPASHGSMFHRRGGSFGQCQWPGEIDKGRKMPGQTGNVSRTTQNLVIVKVLEDKNILLVKGSVHGSKGGIVTIRNAKKRKTNA